jgi:DNA-binding transcriptional LysR family regulator
LDPAGGRQTAKRSPLFADTYAQLARRRGRNIATTAIARRLLARSFHILTQLEAAPAPEKARTGRARVFACAGNTAACAD